jgi:uncharacterized membrane-anchored protein
MQKQHMPVLGPRFWAALCLASIFGANTGDYFARDLGLGHIAGVPFLALAFAVVLVVERFDRLAHEAYYWLAIVLVRTAATNLADFFCGDLKLQRWWVMLALGAVLAIAVAVAGRSWQRTDDDNERDARTMVLRANAAYWFSMLLAGTMGTVMGDYFSHNLHLGDAWASVVLGVALAAFFAVGSRGLIWSVPFFWATIVMVRAAGTVVGDTLAGRMMLGLPISTALTGLVFVAMLFFWNGRQARLAGSR